MTIRIHTRLSHTLLVISLGVTPRGTPAQSAGHIAAFDGLSLSPIGALSPVARAPGELAAGSTDMSIRYGRWRYDADDAVHDTFGLTWARGLAFWKSRLEITAGYALIECPTCTGSAIGSVDLESRLWEHGVPDDTHNPVRTGLNVRLSLGGGKTTGADHTTAGSAAITVPLDVAVPLGRSALVALSVQPGVGYGHIASVDFGNGGLLPMFGAAVSLRAARMGMHVGMQRLIIDGGPTLIGAAFSWRLR